MNADHNYERTVDLAGFLKAVLLHWRQMIILGVLFALILGMLPVLEFRKAISHRLNTMQFLKGSRRRWLIRSSMWPILI